MNSLIIAAHRYRVMRDSVGWFFMWPISMVLAGRWQSFSDFMRSYGWAYVGYGEWIKWATP